MNELKHHVCVWKGRRTLNVEEEEEEEESQRKKKKKAPRKSKRAKKTNRTSQCNKIIGKGTEQKKNNADQNDRVKGDNRACNEETNKQTNKNILFTHTRTRERERQEEDDGRVPVVQQTGLKEDTGKFSYTATRDYHCYYHCLAVCDAAPSPRRRQEVENRLDHRYPYYGYWRPLCSTFPTCESHAIAAAAAAWHRW